MCRVNKIDNKIIDFHLEKAWAYFGLNYIEPSNAIRYSLRAKEYSIIDIEQIEHIEHKIIEKQELSFSDKLLGLITSTGKPDSEIYKAAHIDRRLYSKIISNKDYHPSKDTCIAFALALHLNMKSADDLLFSAGYSLSSSIKRDLVIEYFISSEFYDIPIINAVLTKMGETPLI